MAILILRRYDMEVAHQLTGGVPEGHKCRRLHGHRYVMSVAVKGTPDENGMVIEYDDLDDLVFPLVDIVDHHCLNTLMERDPGSPPAVEVSMNPTVERLVQWFVWHLEARLPPGLLLQYVSIQEDAYASAMWARECGT